MAAIRVNQDHTAGVGNWAEFQFYGRSNKKTKSVSGRQEKGKWELRVDFFDKHTAKVRMGTRFGLGTEQPPCRPFPFVMP